MSEKRETIKDILIRRDGMTEEDAQELIEETPQGLRPVLAKIAGQNCLGMAEWYEVVYFDEEQTGQWKSYSDSKTFDDGERVLAWKYADECL